MAEFLGAIPAEITRSMISFDPEDSLVDIGGNELSSLMLLSPVAEGLLDRYADLADHHEAVLQWAGTLAPGESYFPIDVERLPKLLCMIDVALVGECENVVRARYFQAMLAIDRRASSSELDRQLRKRLSTLDDRLKLLPHALGRGAETWVRAANFASLAATRRVGETTIGRFLEQNADVLEGALGAERIVPQPLLPWLTGPSNHGDQAIQPDFLFVDAAGKGHLCELKLPLLDRSSLTKGGHRRREFISAVSEGLAQLANYRDYFSHPRHRELVESRYGVEMVAPRSVLIVGSAENFDEVEAREASRVYAPVEILDFDTVRALYLLRSGFSPAPPWWATKPAPQQPDD